MQHNQSFANRIEQACDDSGRSSTRCGRAPREQLGRADPSTNPCQGTPKTAAEVDNIREAQPTIQPTPSKADATPQRPHRAAGALGFPRV